MDSIWQKVDMDVSGKIDYSEWVVATANKKSLLTKAKLKKAFDLFDKVLFLLNKYLGWLRINFCSGDKRGARTREEHNE